MRAGLGSCLGTPPSSIKRRQGKGSPSGLDAAVGVVLCASSLRARPARAQRGAARGCGHSAPARLAASSAAGGFPRLFRSREGQRSDRGSERPVLALLSVLRLTPRKPAGRGQVRPLAPGCHREGPGTGAFGAICGWRLKFLGVERRPQRGRGLWLQGTGTLASSRWSRRTALAYL